MSDSLNIPIADDFESRLAARTARRLAQNRCHITIEADSISIRFDDPLPEGPHKVTRLETDGCRGAARDRAHANRARRGRGAGGNGAV